MPAPARHFVCRGCLQVAYTPSNGYPNVSMPHCHTGTLWNGFQTRIGIACRGQVTSPHDHHVPRAPCTPLCLNPRPLHLPLHMPLSLTRLACRMSPVGSSPFRGAAPTDKQHSPVCCWGVGQVVLGVVCPWWVCAWRAESGSCAPCVAPGFKEASSGCVQLIFSMYVYAVVCMVGLQRIDM